MSSFCQLDQLVNELTQHIQQEAQQHKAVKRLQTILGFGPLTAMAFYSAIVGGKAFRNGRDVAAAVGLVPRQYSSGGKSVLLGISKRGDGYLRSLLVHGARAVAIYAHKNR